jgi:hypothetical protein
LDLKAFIKISADYPELIDFFDIFNNKFMQNMSIVINRDHIKRIEYLLANVKRIMDKLYTNTDSNKFTISLKSWVDKIVKYRQSPTMYNRTNTFNNKTFGISNKVTVFMESEAGREEASIISESSELLSEPSEKMFSERNRTETTNSQRGDGFEFFYPSAIKNEEYMKELVDQGIDLSDCLIVNKKNLFVNYLNDIREQLTSILKEYI